MLDKGSNKSSSKGKKQKAGSKSKTANVKKIDKKVAAKTIKKTIKKTNNKVDNKVNKKVKNSKKAILLTVCIITTLVVIAASYYLIKTPKFNITSISVIGNSKADINTVITNSGINMGDNVITSIFNINKKNILNMPYISNVKVSINFPSEFVIEVIESKSVYYAYDKEKNIYYRLDENGMILEVCNELSLRETELLINGITFDTDAKIDTKINDIDYSKILVYKKIEQEFKNIFLDKNITKVNFENSLTKIYIDDKIEVILPNDTNLKYNLTFLIDIIASVGDTQGTIDMTKDNPTFINF